MDDDAFERKHAAQRCEFLELIAAHGGYATLRYLRKQSGYNWKQCRWIGNALAGQGLVTCAVRPDTVIYTLTEAGWIETGDPEGFRRHVTR